MKTTLNIPDELLDEIRSVFGDRSRTDVVCDALEQYLMQKRRENLLGLKGKLSLADFTEELEAAELKEEKWTR